MAINKEVWDSFFTYDKKVQDHENIKGFDEITKSEEYLNLSTEQKIELVNYIIENWDYLVSGISLDAETYYLSIPQLENEYLKWSLIHLPQLIKKSKFELIDQEKQRINDKLKSINNISPKIDFLEEEQKNIKQDVISNIEGKIGAEELLLIIQNEIEYLKSVQKRDFGNSDNIISKIQWPKNPSHLAYILKTLVKMGYIELPPEIPINDKKVVSSKKQVAEYFLNFFEVEKPESFVRLFQNENQPSSATKDDLNKLLKNSKSD